ncbi:MAG: hypothetical protein WCU00_07125 [Candidatus Latescibacterota bacterium]
MFKKIVSLYLSLFLFVSGVMPAVSAPAPSKGEKKVYTLAVLNLDAKGVSQVEAEVLSEKLRSHLMQLIESPGYSGKEGRDQYIIVEQTQMDKILNQFNIQNTGCVSDSCAIEFGKMLQVDRILIGTVGMIGKTYSVSVRIVDVESAKTIKTADRQYKGSIDEVMNVVIINLGNELLLGKMKKKSNTKWYILAGAAVLAGAGAAMSGGGSKGNGGNSSLPLPPSRP